MQIMKWKISMQLYNKAAKHKEGETNYNYSLKCLLILL